MNRSEILTTAMLACGCMLSHATVAHAAPATSKPALSAHAHGSAKLLIALDGNLLTLELESPMDSLVGFEHRPTTEKQKSALHKMAESLQQADRLFVPTPAARCVLQSVKLESPVLDALSAKPDAGSGKPTIKPAAPAKSHGEGHAELDADIVFRCDHPQQLRDLEVKLFERFAGLKRINAQVATAKGQKSVQLSASARRVAW